MYLTTFVLQPDSSRCNWKQHSIPWPPRTINRASPSSSEKFGSKRKRPKNDTSSWKSSLEKTVKESVLTKSKYIFLKNPENLTDPQVDKLSELMGYDLRVVRAYMMKEDFERFWEYKSAYWAGRFLDDWCVRAMRSKIEPMKKFVKMIRKHRELPMNWFKSQGLSSGTVEGFNNKVKLTMRKGYGFRTFEGLETVLYHTLGKPPEPESAHKFW